MRLEGVSLTAIGRQVTKPKERKNYLKSYGSSQGEDGGRHGRNVLPLGEIGRLENVQLGDTVLFASFLESVQPDVQMQTRKTRKKWRSKLNKQPVTGQDKQADDVIAAKQHSNFRAATRGKSVIHQVHLLIFSTILKWLTL